MDKLIKLSLLFFISGCSRNPDIYSSIKLRSINRFYDLYTRKIFPKDTCSQIILPAPCLQSLPVLYMDIRLIMDMKQDLFFPSVLFQIGSQRLYQLHCMNITFQCIKLQIFIHHAGKAVRIHIRTSIRKKSTVKKRSNLHDLHSFFKKALDHRC